MTIKEMISKNPRMRLNPPESIFEVKTASGESRLMCRASFALKSEIATMIANDPDLLEWEVTKEHFTQKELDEYVIAQRDERLKQE